MLYKNIILFLLFTRLFLIPINLLAQEKIVIETNYLPKADTSLIYLPDKYYNEVMENFAVVILLHGYNGNYKQWSEIINLQEYSNKYNFIIATPDGFNSWYFDSPKISNSKFESFFLKQYLPYLKSNFRVDSNNIFISGMSMGGHGALYLYLKNINILKAAGSTSGVVDLNYSSNKYLSLSDLLGEYNNSKEIFNKYSSFYLLDEKKFTNCNIIFDCGNKDHLYSSNNRFKAKCDKLYINSLYFSSQGRHNNDYWRESINWHFIYFKNISDAK